MSVGDFDLPFHRFRVVKDGKGNRSVEHFMVVEIKTGEERLGVAQRDSLSVFNALLGEMIPVNGTPIKVRSRPGYIVRGDKKVIWHGVHLLRVPSGPNPYGPFYWNNRRINHEVLAKVLAFDNDPNHPQQKLDIDRRHKSGVMPTLFQGMLAST
jgi:hypothetical protein